MSGARHIRLHCQGQGPCLLFLHGWTMAGDIFAGSFERLSDRFTCLAPDLPGHGGTTGFSPTVPGAADMLAALLADEGLEEVTLVGWSLGALVGWQHLAGRGTGPVRAMISLDMSPRPQNDAGWALGLRGQDADALREKSRRFRADWPRAAQSIARNMFAEPEGAEGLSVDQAAARIAAQPAGVMADFWDSLIACDLRAAVQALPVPLLAIHGAQSRAYPSDTSAWLAENAPRGHQLVLPGVGHAPLLEAPETTCAAIADFAQSHRIGR